MTGELGGEVLETETAVETAAEDDWRPDEEELIPIEEGGSVEVDIDIGTIEVVVSIVAD